MTARRVNPRVYRHCFECGEDTVQWLTSVYTSSPGSFRGTRINEEYTCSQCGHEQP